jgi:aldehyde:ferredoxin oxidoreductase
MQNYMTFIHCTGVCMFADDAGGYSGVPVYLKLLKVITGDNYSVEDALTLGERVWNLKKAFNMKHGCTRAEDTLPNRLLKQPDKRAQNSVVKLDETLPEYYQVRGWDWKTGKPTKEKLISLGLNTEAQDLWT